MTTHMALTDTRELTAILIVTVALDMALMLLTSNTYSIIAQAAHVNDNLGTDVSLNGQPIR